MPIATHIDGLDCPECGKNTLLWWSEDETERVLELYMNCSQENGCGQEFPKIIVNKSEDTSDSALLERLQKRYS